MPQKYYNTQEAAKVLNVSVDDVKKMLERRELYGYRDGADWKFKAEDIDKRAQESQAEKQAAPADEEIGDVLLSDIALGHSATGTSGTVIAMSGIGGGGEISDIQLAGDNIELAISDTAQTPIPKAKKDDVGSKVSKFEELDLTLDEDLTLEDSTSKLPGKAAFGDSGSGSAIDLSGRELEDDDLVLGGSGKGSDVTIGGDSGISLVDPADSGFSLEQPLDLVGANEESLELGEDDMLSVSDMPGSAPSGLKTDDEFLLTPLDEGLDGDGSESGSQVIALDSDMDGSAGMIGSSPGGLAAMLDEDLSSQPALDMGMVSPMPGAPLLSTHPGGFGETAPMMHEAALPETPYTTWQIVGLAVCAVLLMLCGMMMYDNLRNMWSWDGAYSINSSLMDFFVGMFEGR